MVPESNCCHQEGDACAEVARQQVDQELGRAEGRLVDVDCEDYHDCIGTRQDRAHAGDDGVGEYETGDVNLDLERFGNACQRRHVCDGRGDPQDKVEGF